MVGELLAALVAGTLLASAVGKAAGLADVREWIGSLIRRDIPAVAPAIVAAEVGVAASLVLAPRPGAAVAAVWLVLATLALRVAQVQRLGCGCFGSVRAVTSRDYWRNASLMVIAGPISLFAPEGPSATVAAGALLGVAVLLVHELARAGRPRAMVNDSA